MANLQDIDLDAARREVALARRAVVDAAQAAARAWGGRNMGRLPSNGTHHVEGLLFEPMRALVETTIQLEEVEHRWAAARVDGDDGLKDNVVAHDLLGDLMMFVDGEVRRVADMLINSDGTVVPDGYFSRDCGKTASYPTAGHQYFKGKQPRDRLGQLVRYMGDAWWLSAYDQVKDEFTLRNAEGMGAGEPARELHVARSSLERDGTEDKQRILVPGKSGVKSAESLAAKKNVELEEISGNALLGKRVFHVGELWTVEDWDPLADTYTLKAIEGVHIAWVPRSKFTLSWGVYDTRSKDVAPVPTPNGHELQGKLVIYGGDVWLVKNWDSMADVYTLAHHANRSFVSRGVKRAEIQLDERLDKLTDAQRSTLDIGPKAVARDDVGELEVHGAYGRRTSKVKLGQLWYFRGLDWWVASYSDTEDEFALAPRFGEGEKRRVKRSTLEREGHAVEPQPRSIGRNDDPPYTFPIGEREFFYRGERWWVKGYDAETDQYTLQHAIEEESEIQVKRLKFIDRATPVPTQEDNNKVTERRTDDIEAFYEKLHQANMDWHKCECEHCVGAAAVDANPELVWKKQGLCERYRHLEALRTEEKKLSAQMQDVAVAEAVDELKADGVSLPLPEFEDESDDEHPGTRDPLRAELDEALERLKAAEHKLRDYEGKPMLFSQRQRLAELEDIVRQTQKGEHVQAEWRYVGPPGELHRKYEVGDPRAEGKQDGSDGINHPSHYTHGKYEAIDVIEDWKLNFNLGNALKYICRAEHKGDIIENLKKARFYLDREIQLLQKLVDKGYEVNHDSNPSGETPPIDCGTFKEQKPHKTLTERIEEVVQRVLNDRDKANRPAPPADAFVVRNTTTHPSDAMEVLKKLAEEKRSVEREDPHIKLAEIQAALADLRVKHGEKLGWIDIPSGVTKDSGFTVGDTLVTLETLGLEFLERIVVKPENIILLVAAARRLQLLVVPPPVVGGFQPEPIDGITAYKSAVNENGLVSEMCDYKREPDDRPSASVQSERAHIAEFYSDKGREKRRRLAMGKLLVAAQKIKELWGATDCLDPRITLDQQKGSFAIEIMNLCDALTRFPPDGEAEASAPSSEVANRISTAVETKTGSEQAIDQGFGSS